MKSALCYLCRSSNGQVFSFVPYINGESTLADGETIVGIRTLVDDARIVQGGISSPAFVRMEPRKERLK